MTEIVQTALDKQLSTLKLTTEERAKLYNNLVIAAKPYQRRDQPEDNTTVPLFRKLNLEVFFIKFIEANVELINAHGHTREFCMFNRPMKLTTAAMLILTNGVAVQGYINYNPEHPDQSTNSVAYYKCLEDGVEILRGVDLVNVVLVNTNLSAEALAAIPLVESSDIDAIVDALVIDSARTRSAIITQDKSRVPSVNKFPTTNINPRNKPQ